MKTVGFDFGTTNSLISVIDKSGAINFLDDDGRPIPSAICYEGTRKIMGQEAKKRISEAGLGIHGNIIRSPKAHLGQESLHVEGLELHPIDVVADVAKNIIQQTQESRRYRNTYPGKIASAVVTIPVNMDGDRRRALRDAFKQADIQILQFVHEPLAALYGFYRNQGLSKSLRRYHKKLVLVFDWGGGTLDLTLCLPTSTMVVQIINDGTDEVGGDVFDETIMTYLITEAAKRRNVTEEIHIQPGAKARLLDSCERAKIELSEREQVNIYVANFFRGTEEEDFEYSLTQAELEEITRPLLEKGLERIRTILTAAGYSTQQMALCLATGGMANMPAIRRRLHELFGPQRVEVPKGTATLIAEGAAWIASDNARLQLAKNIELVLARNSYLPLIRAGTEMPRGGQQAGDDFHLYCADPRDGVAKFQICTPSRAGESVLPNDPRVNLENLTITVDKKAKAFQERLELEVKIDEDLILHAEARSVNENNHHLVKVHNLEFGLNFPSETIDPEPHEELPETFLDPVSAGENGSLAIRSNISDREDKSLVPGEFLYTYDPGYFDTRRNPPPIQVNEKLYYQPCSICGRRSNDPECNCSALLPRA